MAPSPVSRLVRREMSGGTEALVVGVCMAVFAALVLFFLKDISRCIGGCLNKRRQKKKSPEQQLEDGTAAPATSNGTQSAAVWEEELRQWGYKHQDAEAGTSSGYKPQLSPRSKVSGDGDITNSAYGPSSKRRKMSHERSPFEGPGLNMFSIGPLDDIDLSFDEPVTPVVSSARAVSIRTFESAPKEIEVSPTRSKKRDSLESESVSSISSLDLDSVYQSPQATPSKITPPKKETNGRRLA
ncbi:hypothetical protein M426DRAFT_23944 [Hypoxylon sp. CI-4A]|nr:hypothetical protein M426DRAFT_23944 [Hypoxylon sp. CI-4A]